MSPRGACKGPREACKGRSMRQSAGRVPTMRHRCRGRPGRLQAAEGEQGVGCEQVALQVDLPHSGPADHRGMTLQALDACQEPVGERGLISPFAGEAVVHAELAEPFSVDATESEVKRGRGGSSSPAQGRPLSNGRRTLAPVRAPRYQCVPRRPAGSATTRSSGRVVTPATYPACVPSPSPVPNSTPLLCRQESPAARGPG